jgi:hypothetical protein
MDPIGRVSTPHLPTPCLLICTMILSSLTAHRILATGSSNLRHLIAMTELGRRNGLDQMPSGPPTLRYSSFATLRCLFD